jgi:Na+/phosphate symporter
MRNRTPHPVVSIVFDRRDPIDPAIAALMEEGIARDLIEVVTDPATAQREFQDTRRQISRQVLADAGRGALIGLLFSFFLSAILVLVVPMEVTGLLTLVQALGPNVGTLGGAVIGMVVGLFRQRQPNDLYCRVRQTGGILMLVHCRSTEQAEQMLALLQTRGGHDGLIVRAT